MRVAPHLRCVRSLHTRELSQNTMSTPSSKIWRHLPYMCILPPSRSPPGYFRFAVFPVEFRDESKVNMLITLQFPARVWKLSFEAHQGYDWMHDLANARAAPLCYRAPPEMSILSPHVGEGGYRAMDFDDASETAPEASEEKVLVSTGEGPPLTIPPTMFPEATRVDASESASESGVSAPLPCFPRALKRRNMRILGAGRA